jgi:hypothetical protein
MLIAALITLFANQAQADQGRPSAATLADMGLAGIDVLSDQEAMAVRGRWIRVRTTSHSKVITFHFSYSTPGSGVRTRGFAWGYAF